MLLRTFWDIMGISAGCYGMLGASYGASDLTVLYEVHEVYRLGRFYQYGSAYTKS